MLSPSMKAGTISKLNLKHMQQLTSHDVVFEVSTSTLLNTTEESVVMDIEVIEDMYVAKVVVEDGSTVKVGQPVALLCDNLADISIAKDIEVKSKVIIQWTV